MNFSANTGSVCRWQRKSWRVGCLVAVFALGGILTSSEAAPPAAGNSHQHYQPDNIFAYPSKLSLDFRRVAVLPVAAESSGGDLTSGCATLTPVLVDQLIKTKRFEVVTVDASILRRITGQNNWTGIEALTPDFFAALRREYGCDGVLFAELTAYHAYAPLEIGWRLKLVDARSTQIIWAADEVFDAATPSVYRDAQRFEGSRSIWPFWHQENWLALNSPRQFGRYSAATLLNTLPDR